MDVFLSRCTHTIPSFDVLDIDLRTAWQAIDVKTL